MIPERPKFSDTPIYQRLKTFHDDPNRPSVNSAHLSPRVVDQFCLHHIGKLEQENAMLREALEMLKRDVADLRRRVG
ncbi:hypothetical protein JL101_035475 (plasmid) [Skermanella rosea]|uniref:hypothetical protein n=1 Tax=Skermanella rosea TaxID=1817965 RepID=UPI001934A25D|nr:hypothetical protein [Skermanella rosea]UEM08100.1 hypothetical protein JL101_035475 [Skermanella rosea]